MTQNLRPQGDRAFHHPVFGSRPAGLLLLIATACVAVSERQAAGEERPVGELGSPSRVVFDGAEAFPSDSLRAGLEFAPEFLDVSHPHAPLGPYLEWIEAKMRLGYRQGGFPETQIGAQHDKKAARIVVKVAEGPRYMCGAVKVSGVSVDLARDMVRRMTELSAHAKPMQPAFQFHDDPAQTKSPSDPRLGWGGETNMLWRKDQPAHFSEAAFHFAAVQATNVLREAGFLFPEVNVQVVPDKAARTADLHVQIVKTGPRAVVQRIELAGNQRNSREAVLRYLGLKPGLALTNGLVEALERQLWQAGRFLTNSVTVGPPDAAGQVTLRIEMAECNDAPPLDKDFSPVETVLLKSRHWLSGLGQADEDLVMSLSGVPAVPFSLELVFSPRNGLALFQLASGKQTNALERAVVLRARHLGIYAPIHQKKLVIDPLETTLKTFVSIQTKAPVPEENPFNLTIGAGFASKEDEGGPLPGYTCDLTMPPVAFVHLAHVRNFSFAFDGSQLVCSNAPVVLKLDSSTGRIIEISAKADGKKGALLGRFEPRAWARALERVEHSPSRLPNAYQTNLPFSSLASFLAQEIFSPDILQACAGGEAQPESLAPYARLIRQLDLAEILSPWNRLFQRQNTAAEEELRFLVPEVDEAGNPSANNPIAAVCEWLIRRNEVLFPAGSWAALLARDTAFAFRGHGQYFNKTVADILESSETGPLACWLIAKVLTAMQSDLAREFAGVGRRHLGRADFRRDYRLLLEGDSVLSQTFAKLTAALRDLDASALETLTANQPADLADLIRDCARRLRQDKEKPVCDVIGPALDRYWDKELKQEFAASLRKLAQPAPPKRAEDRKHQ